MSIFNHKHFPKSIILKITSKIFPFDEIQNICILSGGVFNTSYLICLRRGLKVVLRVAPAPELLVGYQRNLMYAENLAYKLCRKYGVPSPKVYIVDDSFQMTDRVYMLSEYIPSVPLSVVANSNETDMLFHCYRKVGEAVRKMHSISGARFGRLAVQLENGGFDTWGEAIIYEVDMWLQVYSFFNLIAEKVIVAIKTVFNNHVDILNKIISPQLAHGDLWRGNILIDVQHNEYLFRAIIDADHAIFGDPEIDFFGDKMLNDAFVQGYGKNINNDWDSFIRRRLYLFLFTLRQFYIYKCFYHDLSTSEEQEGFIYRFLSEFNVKI